MLVDKLNQMLEAREDEIIALRRHFHQYPELSYFEKETSQTILNFYKDKDCEVFSNVGGYGIKVVIDSKKEGKTIALRADFDALPIFEETDLEFKSVYDGVMHACGHDGHTAYLMVLADCLIALKDELVGKVIIIHQPAEEVPPGGAIAMINDGVLDGVDHVFGIHVLSHKPKHHIYYHSGPTQSARSQFSIVVKGLGGHGASPDQANDAILISSHLVTALQSIVSRRLNPFDFGVLTIGSMDGLGQSNVIKEKVVLEGDVRYLDPKVNELIKSEMINICKGFEIAFRCEIECDYISDYPVLVNDQRLTEMLVESLKETTIKNLISVEDGGIWSASEDFAYYSQRVASSFFYVGAQKGDEVIPHHNPKFDIDESSLLMCAQAMGTYLLHVLFSQ